MTAKDESRLFGDLIRGSLVLLVLLSLSGALFFSRKTGLGVLAGGLLGIGQFLWMRSTLGTILGILPSHAGRYAAAHFMVRLAVLGVIIYLLLVSGLFSPLGLLVGLSIIVITTVGLLFRRTLRTGDSP